MVIGPYDCQFEFDKCIWQSDSANYNWKRKKGGTPTRGTGPDEDHTIGAGYYIFTEASFPAKRGDIAHLKSKQFTPIKPVRCIAFWYHMYGTGTGNLTLAITPSEEGGYPEKVLWGKYGDLGNKWIYDEVELKSEETYSVTFTAIRGRSFLSDIALDDISFKEGSCIKANPIGCFVVSSVGPFLNYRNYRDAIDWNNIAGVVRKCRDFALASDYQKFGIQFYGECWYGPREGFSYEQSNDCLQDLVGTGGTIMVYDILT